jgi:hypothetical protein
MPLKLSLRIELSGSNKILVFDDTGVYNASSNPTGWNGSNPQLANATAFSIVVKRPDSTTFEVSSSSSMQKTFDAFNTLPSLNGLPFTILNTDLGLASTDTIPDGEYEFNATVTVSSVAYTYNVRKVFYYNAFKCKEDKKRKIDITCLDSCKTDLDDVLVMELGFDGIDYNVEAGDTKSAVKILKTISSMCCGC